ncbi:MAG: hypothetical protein WC001_08715 [Desulfurivibrionaceae bacterium]
MKKAVLIVLFLLGGGAMVNWYLNENRAGDQNEADFPGVGPWRVETSFASFLPLWPLNGKTEAVSREGNARVLRSVFEVFNPALKPFLTSVPIVFDSSADTAKAYLERGYIGVSPDWDKTVAQSKHRMIYEQRGMKAEEPVFTQRFKTDLLIHEFLHILQAHLVINGSSFYKAVARWYIDPRYGIPSPSGMTGADMTEDRRADPLESNRIKYIVWHELYNERRLSEVPKDESWKDMKYWARYRKSKKGVEEFAYIGQEILASGSGSENYLKTGQWIDKDWESKKIRLLEVSPEVIAFYRGVFYPELVGK